MADASAACGLASCVDCQAASGVFGGRSMNGRCVSALAACLVFTVASSAAGPQRAPLPEDLAAVPGDALGFIHIRVADVWKSDALKELRDTVMKAGDKALQGFDKRFVPAPSSIE